VLTEILESDNSQADTETFAELQRVFKQINAPVGHLALTTLRATTAAMESGSASDDHRYARVDGQVQSIAMERDALASQIKVLLEGVAFHGRPFDQGLAERLIAQSNALLKRAEALELDE
jgi:hypothetical protein